MSRFQPRRGYEAIEPLVPKAFRDQVKRHYRRTRRAPNLTLSEHQRGPHARPPRFRQIGGLPDALLGADPLIGSLHSALTPADVGLVGASDLDPVLDGLIAAEREALPLACVVDSDAELGSEVAGCATAILASSPHLAALSSRLVPAEHVVVAPSIVATSGLPATYPDPSGASLLLHASGSPLPLARSQITSLGLELRGFGADVDRRSLVRLAHQAIAVAAPPAGAAPKVRHQVAVLAACGVPLLVPSDPGQPFAELGRRLAWLGLVPDHLDEALRTLTSDAQAARAASVRTRRYALHELASAAVTRRLLRACGVPPPGDAISVIVTEVHLDGLSSLLGSLRRQTVQPLEVTVITDSAPTSDAIARLGSTSPWEVKAVPGRRSGFARALRRSRGTYVAFVRTDAIYGPNHLADLRASLETTRARMVGRDAHSAWGGPGGERTRPGSEEDWTDSLLPGSGLARRSDALGSLAQPPRSEDDLQRRLQRHARGLYAVHPLDFLLLEDRSPSWSDLERSGTLRRVFPEGDGGVPLVEPPTRRTDP